MTTATRCKSRTLTLAIAVVLATALASLDASAQSSSAVAAATQPFSTTFSAHRGRIPLGTISFQLKRASESGCFVYMDTAYPNALAKLFIGNIRETSRFCIRNGRVEPQYFRRHIDGKPEDSYTLRYDWSNHTITYQSEDGDSKTMSFGDEALDALTLQIAARLWIARSDNPTDLGTRTFEYVDEDKIKPYKLGVESGGTIQVPAGRYDVINVKRLGHDHHLRFWLARRADWIPVKVEHQKGDGGVLRLTATRLSLDKN